MERNKIVKVYELEALAAVDGSIAAFCTIYYDDYTRSAVTVLVGAAAEHWKKALGKAVITEGMPASSISAVHGSLPLPMKYPPMLSIDRR